MDWYKLKISKSDSLAKMNEWDSIPKPDIEIQWQDLRQDMVNIMKCICRKLDIDETRIQKAAYAFDFNFAIPSARYWAHISNAAGVSISLTDFF